MSGIRLLFVPHQQQLRYGCNFRGVWINYRLLSGCPLRPPPPPPPSSLVCPFSLIFRHGTASLSTTSSSSSSGTILLYKNKQSQTRFFRILFILSGIQLIFWVYLSHFAFTTLRHETLFRETNKKTPPTLQQEATPTSLKEEEGESSIKAPPPPPPWYSSLKWRLTFSLLALGVGVFFTTTACIFPLRVVQSLSYVRGKGGGVSLTTFSPLKGGVREVRAELSDIGMAGSRISDTSKGRQLGMKVKGHRLFYLIDREGEFPNPKLFDTLIGVRRM